MSESAREDALPSESGDPELDSALDSFLAWADTTQGGERIRGLPHVSPVTGAEPGTVLGDYDLIERLGMGGMGVVFEARQRSVGSRRVALKLLRSHFVTDALKIRFRREIATVADLDHSGIVPIVDASVDGETPYYVMKFVEGASLAQVIQTLRSRADVPDSTTEVRQVVGSFCAATPSARDERSGSTADLDGAWEEPYHRWVARLGLHTAEALQYAHEHGVVHRDVKPANLMVSRQGKPLLLDFGLASCEGDDSLTVTGEFIGTTAYASPEQVRGETVDTRSDVYSLGATLYELLTLSRPFDAQSSSALAREIEQGEPAPIDARIPVDLRTILLCALHRSPGRRYTTPGRMAFDLREFLGGHPIQARPPGPLARTLGWVRHHGRLVAAAALVGVTLLGLRVASHVRAGDRVDAGIGFAEEYRSQVQRVIELLDQNIELQLHVPVPVRELERVRVAYRESRVEAARRARRAETELRRAFDHVSGHRTASDQLAELSADRLRLALRLSADVLARISLVEIEDSLRATDRDQSLASLLDPHGRVSLRCGSEEIRVVILRDDQSDEEAFRGSTPTGDIRLEEGSYVALLSRPDGAEFRLPLRIRRDACYRLDPDALPLRDIDLELPGADQIAEGFVYIHAGDTLVEDDPPRWASVDSFQIQATEVSNGLYVDWLGKLERALRTNASEGWRAPSRLPLPRIGADPYIRRVGPAEHGAWRLKDSALTPPRHPVRGLKPMETCELVDSLDLIFPHDPHGPLYSVPTMAELIRAARGADGRRHPWGDAFEFDDCANYISGGFLGRDATPSEIRAFPTDRSPFGVFDLAGSVQESTRDLVPPVPNTYAVFGGSYRSTTANEMTTTSKSAVSNELNPTVGFRLVRRSLPEWMRQPDGDPAAFVDRFERTDSPTVGNGWNQVIGSHPLFLRTNPAEGINSRIESGKLVCATTGGDFSEASSVWHRIHVSERGYRIRAAIQGIARRNRSSTNSNALFRLLIKRGFRAAERNSIGLRLALDGTASLVLGSSYGSRDEPLSGGNTAPGAMSILEIEVREGAAMGRIWSAGAPRPAQPQSRMMLPRGFGRARYVGIVASQEVQATVKADWLEVDPEP